MTDPTPPSEASEPVTGPVTTPPSVPPTSATSATPATPHPVYVEQSNRLNKVAAWVGIVAGSVIVVAVIFGTGFFVGKEVGEGSRGDNRGHHMMVGPGMPMFPMAPRGEFERGPGSQGPFGSGGPMIEMPRSPGGPGNSGGSETTTAPPRP
ncbi:MAG TPA: hypothetical protein VIQ11_02260 [Mycobacterium sp.]